MISRIAVRLLLLAALLGGALALVACGGSDINSTVGGLLGQSDALYVPDLLAKAPEYNGKTVTVDGAYIGRSGNPGTAVLALGVSTLDNGTDAEPLGDQIWLDGFPQEAAHGLHQPGDAVYGFVRVSGQFESGGGYGPDKKYKYRIQVTSAEPIETVKHTEVRVTDAPLSDGKIALLDLLKDPAKYNGQTITTQGYYFWNGQIFVLAEGISTEEDGGSPQPIGKTIWMEGFPADESGKLHLGPNNSYVWGKVEVTGQFKSGGAFGKDGAYHEFLQAAAAKSLETVKK
jgi:hypothetical protein